MGQLGVDSLEGSCPKDGLVETTHFEQNFRKYQKEKHDYTPQNLVVFQRYKAWRVPDEI